MATNTFTGASLSERFLRLKLNQRLVSFFIFRFILPRAFKLLIITVTPRFALLFFLWWTDDWSLHEFLQLCVYLLPFHYYYYSYVQILSEFSILYSTSAEVRIWKLCFVMYNTLTLSMFRCLSLLLFLYLICRILSMQYNDTNTTCVRICVEHVFGEKKSGWFHNWHFVFVFFLFEKKMRNMKFSFIACKILCTLFSCIALQNNTNDSQ